MFLEILTPQKIEFKEEVVSVILPSLMGQLCILPGHAPLISVLASGILKIKGENKEFSIEVDGGIIEVDNNHLTILLKNFNAK